MLGHTSETFSRNESSTRGDGGFFSVAITIALDALMPRDVAPCATAASACSIWTSFPLGENVVSEKLHVMVRFTSSLSICLLVVSPVSSFSCTRAHRRYFEGSECVVIDTRSLALSVVRGPCLETRIGRPRTDTARGNLITSRNRPALCVARH